MKIRRQCRLAQVVCCVALGGIASSEIADFSSSFSTPYERLAYNAEIPPTIPFVNGLTTLYSFNSNAEDLSGNGYDLLAVGTPGFSSGEYVELGLNQSLTTTNHALNLFSDQMTISFWMRVDGTHDSSSWKFASRWGALVSEKSYLFYFYENKIYFNAVASNGSADAASAPLPVTDLANHGWFHVALVFDGTAASDQSNLFIYVTPEGSNNLAPPLVAKELSIDSLNNGPDVGLFQLSGIQAAGKSMDCDGYVTYDRALSRGELEELYDAGRRVPDSGCEDCGGTVSPERNWEETCLKNEHFSVGLTLQNCGNTNAVCEISLEGLDPQQFSWALRKQLHIVGWYYGNEPLADALPLLPRNLNGNWEIEVSAQGIVKLYLGLKSSDQAVGTSTGRITVTKGGESELLTLKINALPVAPPTASRFFYTAFIYTSLLSSSQYETSAVDLEAHQTSMMEWIHHGELYFTAEGEISRITSWSWWNYGIRIYAPRVSRLMLTWFFDFSIDPNLGGGVLTKNSEAWYNAYGNYLEAHLTQAALLGFGVEHFSILPVDEIKATVFNDTNDVKIVNLIRLCRRVKEVAPELPIVATITDYAGPNEVSALLPYLDIVLPFWPYRNVTLSGQPTGYIPRDAFYSTILPAMKAWRDTKGGILGSYAIMQGRSGSIGFGKRVYPIAAFGDGLDGGGHWAYNVWAGSSWDGADATNKTANAPDYQFVYNGREDHPLNLAHNVEGEYLVPSIRWNALREGIQDAELLSFLRDTKSSYNAVIQTAIDGLIQEAVVIAGEFAVNNTSKADDEAYLSDYSDRIRDTYVRALWIHSGFMFSLQ